MAPPIRNPFKKRLRVPASQTKPISLKDNLSYLRKIQVTRSAEKTPKTPYINLEYSVPNMGATGLHSKSKILKRHQKTKQLIIALALE